MNQPDSLIQRIFDEPDQLRDSASPLYLQLSGKIQQAIELGVLKAGDALPSEREIVETVGVSRVTVKRAIDELVNEGLLSKRQGAGTFVASRLVHHLDKPSSFSEILHAVDRHPDSRWIERGIGLATREEQQKLDLQSDEEVVRMYRIRIADDTPVALELAVVPRKYLDNPFELTGSLYEALAERNVRPEKTVQKLRAVSLDEKHAEHLDIEPGTPVLFVERRGYLADGTPIEYTRAHYLGDSFEFTAEGK